MWQVSILFDGMWCAIGPNYNTEKEARKAIQTWHLRFGDQWYGNKQEDCIAGSGFRVDKLNHPETMTVNEILALES